MILFIFEGDKREPRLFEAIKSIFLPKEVSPIVCAYKCNIYKLYSSLKSYDIFDDPESIDTVAVINEILLERGDTTLKDIPSSEISEIYLFFDYDFHHHEMADLDDDNSHIKQLLEFFNDETINGKLYINYPMIESIRYTKELPDPEYTHYSITRQECKQCDFKSIAHEFSAYKSLDHLLLSNNPNESSVKKQARFDVAKLNWMHLIRMNVVKANNLCNDTPSFPVEKTAIAQTKIFETQLCKHVDTDECRVVILNSLPIFIYEYLRELPR